MLNTKGRVSPLGITVDKFQRKTTVKIILRKELESSKPEFFIMAKFYSLILSACFYVLNGKKI